MWSDFSSEPNRPAPTSTHSTRDKEKGTLPQRLIEPGLPSHQRFTPPAWESVVFILFLMENHLGGEAVRNVMIGSICQIVFRDTVKQNWIVCFCQTKA